MAEPLRVAVVGSGAAGCACAWGLLARNEIAEEILGRTISVDVFDASATPGGRVAATPVPDLPGLAVDTGASMFHVVGGRDFFGFSPHNPRLIPLLNALFRARAVEYWEGTFGQASYVQPIWGAWGSSSNFRDLSGDEADLPLRRAMGLFEENPVRPSPRAQCHSLSPRVSADGVAAEVDAARLAHPRALPDVERLPRRADPRAR